MGTTSTAMPTSTGSTAMRRRRSRSERRSNGSPLAGKFAHSLDKTDPLFGQYKEANVILLQLEAFQSFVIGQRIGGQEVTPNINKLMSTSLYFDHFYHQTAQGRTSDADLAANASLQPMPSGSVFTRFADHSYDSMALTLKDYGYTANVFHAYDGGFWNRNIMYDTLGYDQFSARRPSSSTSRSAGRSATSRSSSSPYRS